MTLFAPPTEVQASFPLATVTVYQSGSTDLATIFADDNGTPKPNPFTAGSDGSWYFYAPNGTFDVRFSGAGIPAPFTLGALGNEISNLLGPAYVTIDSCPGMDFDVKVNNAVAQLPPTGGVIDCRGISGGSQVAAGTITLSKTVTLLLPTGAITLQGNPGIVVQKGGTAIIGQGQGSTILQYHPASGPATAIHWQAVLPEVIAMGLVCGLTLDATGNTVLKTAIDVVDAEEMEISDIAISNWSDTSKSSVGIRLQGRQAFEVVRITINADLPFRLSINPHTSIVAADHYHFQDIYVIADYSQPNWLVDDGVMITNCVWDGYQAWVQGKHGLYWNDTTSPSNSRMVTFHNIRWEQNSGVLNPGYFLYLAPNPAHFCWGLNIYNSYCDSHHNGFYIRNFHSGSMIGCMYDGLSTALDADSSVQMVVMGSFFNLTAGAVLNLTGFVPVLWAGNDQAGAGQTAPNTGIGVPQPINAMVMRNNESLAGIKNTGSGEVRLVKLDSSYNHPCFAPDGGQCFTGAALTVSQDLPTGVNTVLVVPNNKRIAGAKTDLTDTIPIALIDTNNNVCLAPQAYGNHAYTISPSWSLGGDVGSGTTIFRGNGNPNGVVLGNLGDLYLNLVGGGASTFWVKETNPGTNIGWVAK
jgi:hypothetical protein